MASVVSILVCSTTPTVPLHTRTADTIIETDDFIVPLPEGQAKLHLISLFANYRQVSLRCRQATFERIAFQLE